MSQAAALLKDRETVVADVLATFGVSKSTLYRYVSPTGDMRRMPERWAPACSPAAASCCPSA